MLNKIPKTIQTWIDKNAEMVDEYHLEDDGYSENHNRPYSIWCYFKPEWINPWTGTGCIHASTVADFLNEAPCIRLRTELGLGI